MQTDIHTPMITRMIDSQNKGLVDIVIGMEKIPVPPFFAIIYPLNEPGPVLLIEISAIPDVFPLDAPLTKMRDTLLKSIFLPVSSTNSVKKVELGLIPYSETYWEPFGNEVFNAVNSPSLKVDRPSNEIA